MNENTKTGIFWGIAVVLLAIAVFVTWPTRDRSRESLVAGRPLFEEFEDPLSAASLRVVNFDEILGQLDTFEVRKDRETGMWTIPSRRGYPADAVEQMRDAANALVGLTILDVQTENSEDHDDLGVVEPKLEDLEVGDEGVGRLVSFKDEAQKTIASLIIGDPVEDEEGKIYVRKPGQDPVYVVSLDDSPLSTRFADWIEEDLLQLSSIDLREIEIKDHNASLGLGGVSLTRNYTATLETDGSEWSVKQVLVYDPNNPQAAPTEASPDEDSQPNQSKLDELKDALDDLKIVDVVRKPEGMSANLRADKELVADDEAVSSLAERGFIPLERGTNGESEIISANGELTATLQDGVRYVLRFGNVSGVSEEDENETGDDDSPAVGVNRYLLVTAEVDESRFPTPELQSVPETLEDLEQLLGADSPQEEQPAESPGDRPSEDDADDKTPTDDSDEPDSDEPAEEQDVSEPQSEEPEPSDGNDGPEDDGPEGEPTSGELESSGSGEATGSGQGQDPSSDAEPEDGEPTEDSSSEDQPRDEQTPADDDVPQEESQTDDGDMPEDDANADDSGAENEEGDDQDADEDEDAADQDAEAEDADDDQDAEDGDVDQPADSEPMPKQVHSELEGLTEEEKLERLEAEQEKITKENQRILDERNDQIEAARRRVRALNARFADWYYVIPEATYQRLRIRRSELFEPKTDDPPQSPDSPPVNLPNFESPIPGTN